MRIDNQDIDFVIDINFPSNIEVDTVKSKLVECAAIVAIAAVQLIEVELP